MYRGNLKDFVEALNIYTTEKYGVYVGLMPAEHVPERLKELVPGLDHMLIVRSNSPWDSQFTILSDSEHVEQDIYSSVNKYLATHKIEDHD